MAGPGEVFSHIRQVVITRLVDSHSYSIYQLLQLLRPLHGGPFMRRALSRTSACDNLGAATNSKTQDDLPKRRRRFTA
jgi:hypothetical protein